MKVGRAKAREFGPWSDLIVLDRGETGPVYSIPGAQGIFWAERRARKAEIERAEREGYRGDLARLDGEVWRFRQLHAFQRMLMEAFAGRKLTRGELRLIERVFDEPDFAWIVEEGDKVDVKRTIERAVARPGWRPE